MHSIACEKPLALIVEQQLAQFARKCLEEHSYWDDSRRLTQVINNHIAIPVNAQCEQALLGAEGKRLHGNISYLHTSGADTDGGDMSKMGTHQSAELAESTCLWSPPMSESDVRSNIRKVTDLPCCCGVPEKRQSTTSPGMSSSKAAQASKTGSRPFLSSDSSNESERICTDNGLNHSPCSEHEHLWCGRIFDIEAKLVYMNLPLSKKAKLITPYERLRIMIEGWVKEGKIHWKEELAKAIPKNWERHGDLVLLPSSCFRNPVWLSVPSLWSSVATTMNCTRIARRGCIQSDDFRSPTTELLLGTDPYVTHADNGIIYTFNICYSMFSSGNITEKLRIADLDCSNETVVDLYAGIGYFTLPYLVHARAKLLYACEWNPHAVNALHKNLKLNSVDRRCVVLEGDNRKVCPKGVADRVNLGLIPSSEQGWPVACAALNPITGGILHIHGNVDSYPQQEWTDPKYGTTSDKPSGTSDPDAKDCPQEAAECPGERNTLKLQLESGDLLTAMSKDHMVTVECSADGNAGKVSYIPRDCPQGAAECPGERTTLKLQLESGDLQTAMSKDHMAPIECSIDGNTGNTPDGVPYSKESTLVGSELGDGCEDTNQGICHSDFLDRKLSETYSEFKQRNWVKWGFYAVKKMKALLYEQHESHWNVEMVHIEHVKSYAPHVDHIVIDLRCQPIS